MPEFHPVVWEPAHGEANHTGLSDAELTERFRAGAPPAFTATQELKRRHLPAVLTYAQLCGRNQVVGRQLAVQVFRLATQEASSGIEPRGNWRHHLLMLVQRVGLTWARGSRRDLLQPDFAAWIDETVDTVDPNLFTPRRFGNDTSFAMVTGFYRLTELTRGILWYAVVDNEPDDIVATFLKIQPRLVPELRTRAQDAMRQAYIQAYLEAGGDRKCLGFRRIIEAAARPGDRRYSEDLTLHLETCPSCPALIAELARMSRDPRTAVAEGLLRWGGSAYVARTPVRGLLNAVAAQPGRSSTSTVPLPALTTGLAATVPHGTSRRRGAPTPSRSMVLVASAVVITAVVVAVLATTSDVSRPVRGAAAEVPIGDSLPARAASFPTASVSTSASPSPSPSKSPSPTPRTSAPAAKPPAPSPTKKVAPRPVPIAVGGGYTRVVNAATGMCLDIEGGVMANHTEVITAPCTGAATQLWSAEAIGVLRSRADSDYCLDSRGGIDRGAGLWNCESVNGRNGMNLRFTVDGSGAIHPEIAPDFALEPLGPSGGGPLDFDPADGSTEQCWTTGTV